MTRIARHHGARVGPPLRWSKSEAKEWIQEMVLPTFPRATEEWAEMCSKAHKVRQGWARSSAEAEQLEEVGEFDRRPPLPFPRAVAVWRKVSAKARGRAEA